MRRRVATCAARVDAAEAKGEARYVTSRVAAVVGSLSRKREVEVVCRFLAFALVPSQMSDNAGRHFCLTKAQLAPNNVTESTVSRILAEPDSRSSSQETPGHLRNPKVLYPSYWSPFVHRILNLLYPTSTHTMSPGPILVLSSHAWGFLTKQCVLHSQLILRELLKPS